MGLLLPLLVVAAGAGVIGYSTSQRATLVDRLTAIVERGPAADALAVLDQLDALPQPPMAVLVVAAGSADLQVAAAARRSIAGWLASGNEQVEASRNLVDVADSLSELTNSLSRRQKSFAAADQAWVAETTHAILRLANKLPPHIAPTLAAECDALLAATDVVALAQVPFAPMQPTPNITANTAEGFEASTTPSSGASALPLPAPWPSVEQPPLSAVPWVPSPAPLTPPPAAAAMQNQLRASDDENGSVLPIAPAARPAVSGNASVTIVPATKGGNTSTIVPQFRRPAAFTIQQLPSLDTRSLLTALRDESGVNAVAIQDELARRGFGKVTKSVVDQFLSTDVADRLRFAEVVLNDRSLGARPWLLLLAEDEQADVRLLAITILATSGDAALLEKAWQMAIRDRDPRIADLAPRLRERQGTTRR
jgi:hypothetical protein